VKKNTVLTLHIEGVNAKGFGVARVNDFVLLVDGALPGDTLEARLVKLKSRYGYAKAMRIVTPSPHRVTPKCPVSQRCGGCQFQHCDYPAQLAFKKQIVTDALTRIGGIENAPVADVLGTAPTRYRNKAVFPVAPAQNPEGFAIGMYAPRSHRMVEIDDCLIQHPAHIRVLSVVKKHMLRHKISAYDETAHQGQLRQIMIRTSLATGEIMVVLVVNGEALPREIPLAQALAADAGATTVLLSPHTSRGNAVLGERFRILLGNGFIEETIGPVRYRISAPSFFQVNPVQAKVLYDVALRLSGLHPTTPGDALDAHAGAGGIALYAAHAARHIVGIDIVAPAIADAKKNAAINGITNVHFLTGAAEEVVPTLLTGNAHPQGIPSDFRPDVVFLDPPRRGCEPPLLDALISCKAPKIIYISCDPATLARDIKHLCTAGYTLSTVQPVDMFPMTGHVEAIALLRRADT